MWRALTYALVTVAMMRAAAADCAAPTGKLVRAKVPDAVFLTLASDLLGHRAAYFFDTASGTVLGPLDLDAWPGSNRHGVASPSIAFGARGALEITAWLDDPTRVAKALGYFEAFRPAGTTTSVATLLPQIDDAFVLGLIAGSHPSAPFSDALAALRADPNARERAAHASQGVLYTADDAHVQALLGASANRDVAGARLDRLAMLARGGLAAIAKLPADPIKLAWTDYLPELAQKYAAQKDLRLELDDLLLGHPSPIVPVEGDPNPAKPSCGPTRKDLRGPFASTGELTNAAIRDLLRAKDKAFADKVELAFKDVSAGADQYVVAIRAGFVLVAGAGSDSFIAITPDHSIAVGAKLRWVARKTAARVVSPSHLDPRMSVIVDAGTTTRLDSPSTDETAMLADLKARARSGNAHAGTALALLFELAGQVKGWKLDDARAFAYSLPGNTYETPAQWAQAWSEIFTQAIREAPDAKLADEVERALPVILSGFLRTSTKPTLQLPAEVVRKFVIDLAIDIAARRLLAGDSAGAERIATLADGPVVAIAGANTVGPDGKRDVTYERRITTLKVLVAAMRKHPISPPAEAERRLGMDLFGLMFRPYAASVRSTWVNALVGVGYPKPR